ncbi:MAG: MBL fold metallo-hydrolase [Bacteroidia bacterium]
MLIQQIYTKCLSQASYYIESEGTAAIVDPIRDIDCYVKMADERKAKIRYVFITHFHADFVSGHLELAKKTGAIIVFGPHAKPHYPALVAEDSQYLSVGKCKIEVLHTPGHTIESTCFLLYDENKKPYAIFSGDTLFVGDVGRPDLLSGNLDAKELASMLYDSIQKKIKILPDEVIVYPGHGAGSACGKNLGKETQSTIGEQKKLNYALRLGKEEFITAVTTDQPLAPAYFFKDAQININGYENLDNVLQRSLKALSVNDFKEERDKGAIIIDVREASAFGRQFIKGAINIGLDGQFAIWAGTLIDFNHPLILVTDPGKEKESMIRLARIGYDNIKGYLDGGIISWTNAKEETDSIETVTIKELKSLTVYYLLDVRKQSEFEKEKIPESLHIPLEELNSRMHELDINNNYAVYCVGGYRSMIAASILRRNRFKNILNIEGGITKIKNTFPELVEIA